MNGIQKAFAAAAAVCLGLFATTLFAGTWAISRYGFVSVRIDDRHHSFTIPVPAALGHWGIEAARWSGGMTVWTGAGHVPARALRDLLTTIGRELEEAPDGVYLEVESRDAWVRIAKEGRVLRIKAREWDGGGVEVSVPAALARRSVEAVRVRG
jgi:hypothetical protein